AAGSGAAATHAYKPFVTDFQKPAAQAKLNFDSAARTQRARAAAKLDLDNVGPGHHAHVAKSAGNIPEAERQAICQSRGAVSISMCAATDSGNAQRGSSSSGGTLVDRERLATPEAAKFIPGVTDFGIARRASGASSTVEASASAKPVDPDWGEVGAGAAIGAAFASFLAAALALTRRRNRSPLGRAAQPN